MGYSITDLYPSRYLKAEEFEEGEERILTIKDVQVEDFQGSGKTEKKPILYFREDKPLVLNKTNGSIIAKLYGPQTDDWFGKQVTVFTMEVQSFDDIVRAIRIRPKIPVQKPQAQPNGTQAQSPYPTPNSAPQATEAAATPLSSAMRNKITDAAVKVFGSDRAPQELNAMKSKKWNEMTEDEGAQLLDAVLRMQAQPAYPDDEEDDGDPFSDE